MERLYFLDLGWMRISLSRIISVYLNPRSLPLSILFAEMFVQRMHPSSPQFAENSSDMYLRLYRSSLCTVKHNDHKGEIKMQKRNGEKK
jgi:hypothetical protein